MEQIKQFYLSIVQCKYGQSRS